MEVVHPVIEDMHSSSNSMRSHKVGLVYDERMTNYFHKWVPEYPECPDRLVKPLERCFHYGLVERCHTIKPRRATKEEVLRKHSKEHYELLEKTAHMDESELKKLSMKFDGIYFHPNSFDAAMLAAGCAIEAVENVLNNTVRSSFALVRPPGHHAMRDEPNGYCYLNNVSIAAAHAIERHNIQRILIIDWGIHHGQGTQSLFYNDPRVLYFSTHRYEHGNFWPNLRQSDFDFIGGEGAEGFNVNVPINETGIHDGDFLAMYQQILMPIAFEFNPELVIVSCGFDAAIGDPESLNLVTPACFAHLTHMVKQISDKTCFVFEGGYCMKSLSECTALTLKTLLGDPCPKLPPLSPPSVNTTTSILNCIRVLRPFWNCFQYQVNDGKGTSLSKLDMTTPKEGVRLADITGPNEIFELDVFERTSPEEAEKFDLEIDQLIKDTYLDPPHNRTCIAYDDTMLLHKQISGDHPEQPARVKRIMQTLEDTNLLDRCKLLQMGRRATEEELNLVHSPDYTRKIKEYSSFGDEKLNALIDSDPFVSHVGYICEATFDCGLVAVGCALNVVDEVVSGRSRNGFAVVRPPGHHAEESEANGFCFWNTISISAKYSQQRYNLKRILIIDWDIHHGNGTQSAFYSDPSVLVISIHRRDDGRFYPCGDANSSDRVGEGSGVGFNINIPWPKGRQGNSEYMAAFQQIIMPVAYEFSPDLVLVSAGFDAAIGDPLGGCCVLPEMFGHMTHLLSSLSGGHLILILEGGYNLNSLSMSAASCVSSLLGDPLDSVCLSNVNERAVSVINEVISIQQKYWKSLAYQVNLPSRDDTSDWLISQIIGWESVRYRRRPKNVFKEVVEKSMIDGDDDSSLDIEKVSPTTPPSSPLSEPSPTSTSLAPPYSILQSLSSDDLSDEPVGAPCSSGVGEKVARAGDELIGVLTELALGEDHLKLHAVQPLTWCPHLDALPSSHPSHINTRQPCVECNDDVENWMCLSCFEVYCSRFRNSHMVKHADVTQHHMVLSFSDLSVWCYECDSYIDNQLLMPVKELAYTDKFHKTSSKE